MSDAAKLLTVGELMDRLDAVHPDTIVAVKCEDNYYSGPVETATSLGTVVYVTQVKRDGFWFLADDYASYPDEKLRLPAFLLELEG